MSDPATPEPAPDMPGGAPEIGRDGPSPVAVPRWLALACRWMAVAGGLVLVAMMAMTVVSVTRRTLFGAPLPGDFEMIEMGAAIAIFAFLPWCQIRAGNVLVDVVTMRAPPRLTHRLEALGDLAYLGIALLLLWRLSVGGRELYGYGEASMVLRLPVWWGFVVILPALALLALACGFTLLGHLRPARR